VELDLFLNPSIINIALAAVRHQPDLKDRT